MRLAPNRYSAPEKPVVFKKDRAQLVHVSPPIKGLAEDAKSAEADAKFAGILVNLYADDDRLTVPRGTQEGRHHAGGQARRASHPLLRRAAADHGGDQQHASAMPRREPC